ncbi:hypothetical protein QTP88_024498 [Uroleucon formosanum]
MANNIAALTVRTECPHAQTQSQCIHTQAHTYLRTPKRIYRKRYDMYIRKKNLICVRCSRLKHLAALVVQNDQEISRELFVS